MKKALLGLLTALALVTGMVMLAPAAYANEHGTSCGGWQHQVVGGTGTATGCVATNTGTLGIEALVRWRLTGSSTGTWVVDFDYVRLLRDNVEVDSSETDRTITLNGTWQQVDTGWHVGDCTQHNYKATARYRFRHIHGATDHTSGWITRSSGVFSATICA